MSISYVVTFQLFLESHVIQRHCLMAVQLTLSADQVPVCYVKFL